MLAGLSHLQGQPKLTRSSLLWPCSPTRPGQATCARKAEAEVQAHHAGSAALDLDRGLVARPSLNVIIVLVLSILPHDQTRGYLVAQREDQRHAGRTRLKLPQAQEVRSGGQFYDGREPRRIQGREFDRLLRLLKSDNFAAVYLKGENNCTVALVRSHASRSRSLVNKSRPITRSIPFTSFSRLHPESPSTFLPPSPNEERRQCRPS